ncbi:MAG: phosphate ABC transporter permease PstA [Nigerium sp.]|nr:phosphate ABC transporter permease PstA [Nigerium sp.]
MTTVATTKTTLSSLTGGELPRWTPWAVLAAAQALGLVVLGTANLAGAIVSGVVLYLVTIAALSGVVEGRRKATDRLVTSLVVAAFVIATVPLVSVTWTALSLGLRRFDAVFFTHSMAGVVGEGGGALHAIIGTLLITLAATVISVPIGLMTSIYLVEYGRGPLARVITFFVDVMTGIPSIVAGLFAYALFSMMFGPGHRSGISGAVALSVLMIPVVVRSSEEMLRIVPNELREAAYALGVPKWLTIVKVVLPTCIAGIMTGVVLAIARVIGETAPLLLTAGYIANMNYNLFADRMTTLPLFVFTTYRNSGGTDVTDLDRAWAGSLVLILIVLALNLAARLIARYFAPKTGR